MEKPILRYALRKQETKIHIPKYVKTSEMGHFLYNRIFLLLCNFSFVTFILFKNDNLKNRKHQNQEFSQIDISILNQFS